MALTEVYVDPSIAADSGTGTIGDPYGDLEYAIEQTTFDTVNGTRVNIKAGTDEILAANLATALADTGTSAAWVPTPGEPAIFQGYTSTAGDGGIGGISGGGAVTVMTSATLDYVFFLDLHMHNCGSAAVIDLDNWCVCIRCEVDNTTGGGILLDLNSLVRSCHVHNVGGVGIQINSGIVEFCKVINGTNKCTYAMEQQSLGFLRNNIISVDSTSDGIHLTNDGHADHNSIYSAAGTGQGVWIATSAVPGSITNNVVEGFSGAGGIGFDVDAGNMALIQYGGNAAYNNETDFTTWGAKWALDNLGDNEVLSASPFNDAPGGDFAPVDTGNVKEGSLPALIGVS